MKRRDAQYILARPGVLAALCACLPSGSVTAMLAGQRAMVVIVFPLPQERAGGSTDCGTSVAHGERFVSRTATLMTD